MQILSYVGVGFMSNVSIGLLHIILMLDRYI